MTFINQTQAADLLGITSRRLRQIEKDSGNSLKTPDGYPCREFGEFVRERALESLRLGEDGELYDYQTERARLPKLQADHEELKVQEKSQALIPAEMVTDALSEVCTNIKTKLMALPTKLAHKIADTTSVQEIQGLLDEQVREALTEIYTEVILGGVSSDNHQVGDNKAR